ncbi:MAG: hypothetical protein WC833_04045 [Bacteroidales bacterium]|jgi:hypothetical protein
MKIGHRPLRSFPVFFENLIKIESTAQQLSSFLLKPEAASLADSI